MNGLSFGDPDMRTYDQTRYVSVIDRGGFIELNLGSDSMVITRPAATRLREDLAKVLGLNSANLD